MSKIDITKWSFLIGVLLLFFYISLMAGALLALRIHVTMNYWLPIGLGIFLALSLYFIKSNKVSFNSGITYVIVVSLLAFLCIKFGTYSHEMFFDAIWYHHDGVYQFVSGWNPYTAPVPAEKTAYCADYINHFPKGHWVLGAQAYKLFTSIEAGKGFNLIALLSLLFCSPFLLVRIFHLNSWQAWISSIVLSLNPISLQNLFSFYVDGPVASLSILSILFLFVYLKEKDKNILYLILISCFGLLNLKFSAAFVAMLIGLITFATGFYGLPRDEVKSRAIILFSFAFLVLMVFDWHPYISNWLEKGHPLYPVSKPDFFKEDNYPGNFVDQNRFFKFFFSLWAESGWVRHPANAQLKSIFHFSGLGVFGDGLPDLGGMGPLFAEGFSLSQVLFFLWLIFGKDELQKKMQASLFVFFIWVLIFLNPEAWIFRYIPWIWLLSFLPLACLFNNKFWRWPSYFILLALAFNTYRIIPIVFNSQHDKAAVLTNQIKQLRGHESQYDIDPGWSYTYKNRLAEMGIDTTRMVWIALEDTPYIELKGSLGGKFRLKE